MGVGVWSQQKFWESVKVREVEGKNLATSAVIMIAVLAVATRQHRGLHTVKSWQHEAFSQRNHGNNCSNFGAFMQGDQDPCTSTTHNVHPMSTAHAQTLQPSDPLVFNKNP